MKTADEDEEYARLFSRMDELEKEELEAENGDECESEDGDVKDLGNQVSLDNRVKNLEVLFSHWGFEIMNRVSLN